LRSRRSYTLWALLLIVSFSVMAGGCGGSGNSGGETAESSVTGDSNDSVGEPGAGTPSDPAATPTPPVSDGDTPVASDPGGNPIPSDPGVVGVNFYALSGAWVAASGTGVAAGDGVSYRFALDSGESQIVFDSGGSQTNTSAEIDISALFTWDVYDGSSHIVESLSLGTEGTERVQVIRTGDDSFRYSLRDGSTVDVTINSSTTASVTETGVVYSEGGYSYEYELWYDMEKIGDSSPGNPGPDPISTEPSPPEVVTDPTEPAMPEPVLPESAQ
jgi:hypothetical protein